MTSHEIPGEAPAIIQQPALQPAYIAKWLELQYPTFTGVIGREPEPVGR